MGVKRLNLSFFCVIRRTVERTRPTPKAMPEACTDRDLSAPAGVPNPFHLSLFRY